MHAPHVVECRSKLLIQGISASKRNRMAIDEINFAYFRLESGQEQPGLREAFGAVADHLRVSGKLNEG